MNSLGGMMHTRAALAVLGLASASILLGCSGGGSEGPPLPPIEVSVATNTGAVEAGGTASLEAITSGDPRNQGVTWGLSGPGTLSDFTSTAVTYNAPADPPASDTDVTIVAISKADPAKQSTVSVTVFALNVSLSAPDTRVTAGGSVTVSATETSDRSGKGVTWALNGPGTLSNLTSTAVTYNAPPDPLPSDTDVKIVATLQADPSKQAEITLTVVALSVSISASATTVPAGSSASLGATVVSDPSGRGVTWSLSPASGAGTLSDVTTTSATYNALASAPSSDLQVTVTGTSVADNTRSDELTITVPKIRVSVSPTTGTIPISAQHPFTATIDYDPAAAGVMWSLTQSGTPCSPACGTIAPVNEADTTFTAPTTVPSDANVTLSAASVTDHTASASAAITLTAGTVKLVPNRLVFGRTKRNFARALAINLTNTGSGALNIIGISITDPSPPGVATAFSQTNDCGVSVAAAASCTIRVQFKPGTSSAFSATLSISDSSPDSPQRVSLFGPAPCVPGSKGCMSSAAQSTVTKSRIVSVPAPTGTNVVGTRVLDLNDPARDDPYLANGTKRELLVRLWYPASADGGCIRAQYTSPQVWKYFSQLSGLSLPAVRTNSCLDARLADGAYPVVVFTPGFTGTFTDYTFLFEDLASRGYVVASVDHTYEATAVAFPDGRLARSMLGSHLSSIPKTDRETMSGALSVRLGDLKFVLDELERFNRTADSPLTGHLDFSAVAIAGHSFGGLTALEAMEHEPRFRAAISMDGVVPDSDFNPTDKPVLIVDANRDLWTDDELGLWDKLRGPRLALNLKGSEHVTPSDAVWLARGAVMTGTMTTDKTIEAIRDYVAAFLDANLRGQPGSRLLSNASANYPGVEVTLPTQSPCCRWQ
jgi:dienelactone hydrolase